MQYMRREGTVKWGTFYAFVSANARATPATTPEATAVAAAAATTAQLHRSRPGGAIKTSRRQEKVLSGEKKGEKR
jgi:hypothetical protein